MFLSLFLKVLSRFSWYLIKIRHHVLCIVFISDCFWQLLIQQILSANNLPRKKDPTCTLICVSNIKLALSYISEICTTNNITAISYSWYSWSKNVPRIFFQIVWFCPPSPYAYDSTDCPPSCLSVFIVWYQYFRVYLKSVLAHDSAFVGILDCCNAQMLSSTKNSELVFVPSGLAFICVSRTIRVRTTTYILWVIVISFFLFPLFIVYRLL